ncbi:hypothetical protein BDZ85DRAFT_284952 [Elsinoe ampelina]|uniref:Uncharacterized protein n=1 Tax=Elsinoe ampelina TaxID=302913 RepID=A0A6A6G2V8_9PEZI|nr:hypothetical protein BDZ85DRAFT_284952 [Elsinoe ampelina]
MPTSGQEDNVLLDAPSGEDAITVALPDLPEFATSQRAILGSETSSSPPAATIEHSAFGLSLPVIKIESTSADPTSGVTTILNSDAFSSPPIPTVKSPVFRSSPPVTTIEYHDVPGHDARSISGVSTIENSDARITSSVSTLDTPNADASTETLVKVTGRTGSWTWARSRSRSRSMSITGETVGQKRQGMAVNGKGLGGK